jgi:pyrroline-5-carboxylate reductase
MKLTLIGNGLMAQALARGLVNNFELEIIGRDIKKLQEIKKQIPEVEIKVLSDSEDISSKNIIFCVKPYALQSVAARLQGQASIIFSILAGTTLDTIKKQIKAKFYIRTMPNVAASVSKSMTTITALVGISSDQVDKWSKQILALSGEVAQSPKDLADAMYFITYKAQRGTKTDNFKELHVYYKS